MEERFPIYLIGADRACWLDPLRRTVTGEVAAAVAAAGEREIVLVVPGEAVVTAEVQLPPVRQAARRHQAARYALEDRLAAPVESLHFALGRRHGDHATPVAAVAHEHMTAWLEALREHGAEAAAVVPDYLCLPPPEDGSWRIWLSGGRALVRCDDQIGFACECDLLPSLLAAESADSPRLDALAVDDEDNRALLERLREHGYEATADLIEDEDGVLSRLLAGAVSHPPLDLRQSDYARVSQLDAWWRPLRASAALFAGWLVLALAVQGLNYWQLRQEAEALRAHSESVFREAFPQVERIRDLRVQAEEQLGALRGDGSASTLFTLLQATANATGGDDGLRIESLQYRDGALYLSLSGEDVQALERLRAGFGRQAAARLVVESADAGSGGVQIRARVERETEA